MKIISRLKDHKYAVSLIAFWAVSVVLLTAGYWILHQPKKQLLGTVQNQYIESKDMLVIANLAIRKDVQDRQQQQLNESRQTVNQFSVPHNNTTGLVFEIGKIANELHLAEFASKNLPVRDVPTLRKNEGMTEAWLKVEFRSSFLKFAKFVNRLERQTPAVFIERVTFLRNEDDPKRHDVKMELSFLVKQDQDKSMVLAQTATESSENVN